MPRVIHFEIHAEDPERAVNFYRELFGWEFTSWGGPMEYWVIRTGPDDTPGINGGLIRRRGAGPTDGQAVNAYCCTIDVSNVDDCWTKAEKLGAQLALPKMPIPGLGWLMYIKDTEGNILGIMHHDATAK